MPLDRPAPPKGIETDDPELFVEELRAAGNALPDRIDVDSESVEHGLVKLVLSLVEFIRQLLERQAVRRMEGGRLTKAEVEAMGLALLKLDEKMNELKSQFGLAEEDLTLGLRMNLDSEKDWQNREAH